MPATSIPIRLSRRNISICKQMLNIENNVNAYNNLRKKEKKKKGLFFFLNLSSPMHIPLNPLFKGDTLCSPTFEKVKCFNKYDEISI
ncbi:hypothetical protein PMALA_006700 [Plasmodium malariae]|uniref:Uncharacterized protein n=1 Tax=Plasmodium malariae TaxID=5858 RepID=A0A1A8VVP7_PLAMA|nr:hypothetical protein PMALA_006700 [Plasmodium malariae]